MRGHFLSQTRKLNRHYQTGRSELKRGYEILQAAQISIAKNVSRIFNAEDYGVDHFEFAENGGEYDFYVYGDTAYVRPDHLEIIYLRDEGGITGIELKNIYTSSIGFYFVLAKKTGHEPTVLLDLTKYSSATINTYGYALLNVSGTDAITGRMLSAYQVPFDYMHFCEREFTGYTGGSPEIHRIRVGNSFSIPNSTGFIYTGTASEIARGTNRIRVCL